MKIRDSLCAVLILNPEYCPNATSQDLGESDEEGDQRRVLSIGRVYGVEYPIETDDGIDDHRRIVPPCLLVCESIAEEGVFGVHVE